ncbi:hypothetical protein [Microbacterium sp. KR10-403]
MTSPASPTEDAPPTPAAPRFRLGLDWWAVILAGVFVLLAVTDLLPTIGW